LLGPRERDIDRASGAEQRFRIVALVATAFAVLIGAATSAGAVKPRVQSASYRDARGEDPQAPDITRVVVSDDRTTVTFRIWIANRPQPASDMGLQVVIDADRRQATGNQSLVYSLGADYLIQMLGGTPGLLRWDPDSGRWLACSPQPTWSYRSGRAMITLRAAAVRNPSAFTFAVSAASGLIVDRDGTVDITTAHFDFAPDVGHGGWRFRP
jgi:hypothetical protein